MKLPIVALLAALAFAGCESTSSPKAPPVTAAMAKSGGRAQEVEMALLSSGRLAFINRCARCHALPDVNEYNRSEWPGFVAEMAKRSGLIPTQREAVLAYILAAHQN